MQRMVKRELIDEWLDEAYPNAVTKLSVKSNVSVHTISKIRNGRVPKDAEKRSRLARAIGVNEDELFPILPDGEDLAS